MQPAFGPLRAGPAALAALARLGRVRVPDRLVALVMERVVGQPALADVRPAVLVGPVGEWVGLPELVLLVPAELRSVRAQRRLVAADAGDPGIEVEQRTVERLDLDDREVEVGIRLPEPVRDRVARERLDLRVVPALDRAPELVRLREQVLRVDREDPGVRLELEQHVEQDRLLLLEGAGERDPARKLLEHELENPLGPPRLDVSR